MSGDDIVEVLRSVESVRVEGDDVLFRFVGSEEDWTSREFDRGSFTRELLEMIEDRILR